MSRCGLNPAIDCLANVVKTFLFSFALADAARQVGDRDREASLRL